MEFSVIGSASAITAMDAPASRVVSPGFFLASFATVPDPRRRQGTRYHLAAILALAVVAILSNCTSVLAIAQFGADASLALRHALGFPDGKTSRQSTRHRLFAKLDPDALIAVLSRARCWAVPPPSLRGGQGVAIDRKAQRGRLAANPAAGVHHGLSAYCHEVGVVLSQAPIAHGTDKAEAELTVTPALIASVD